nr:hypothetical protein [Shuttleworthia satelles]
MWTDNTTEHVNKEIKRRAKAI